VAEFSLSLLLRADAGQARTELATVPVSLASITTALQSAAAAAPAMGAAVAQAGATGRTAMTQTSAATDAAAASTRASALTFEQLRASVDPAYAAAERYRQVQVALAAMVDTGEASQRAANIVLEQAASRYMGVATAAERKAQAERDAAMASMLATQGYQALRASVDPLYASSMRYAQALDALDAAQAAGVISDKERLRTLELLEAQMIGIAQVPGPRPLVDDMRAVGDNAAAAAQHTAVLGYQVNDVLMMASLGQSPFALMMQQGPQVIQVMNQMRASGMAIGPAIASSITALINPMALVTLAVIAGTAALVQWGTAALSSGVDADALSEQIDALTQRVQEYQDAVERSASMDVDLVPDFGTAIGQARELIQLQEDMIRIAAERAASESARSLARTFQADDVATAVSDGSIAGDVAQTMALGDIALSVGVDLDQSNIAEVRDLAAALDDLANAQGPDAQAVAMAAVRDAILAATGGVENMSDAVFELYRQLLASEEAALKLNAAQEAKDLERQADLQEIINRNLYERQSLIDDERGSQALIRSELEAIRALQADDTEAARDKIAELTGQAQIHQLIAQYGADSVQVEQARAAAAREVYAEWVDGLAVSQAVKDELLAAYDIEQQMAAAAISGPISAGANEAARLAANLQAAMGAIAALQSANLSTVVQNAGVRAEVAALEAGQSAADAAVARTVAEAQTRLAPALGGSDMGARMAAEQALADTERQAREQADLTAQRTTLLDALRPDAGGGAGSGGGTSAGGPTREDVADLINELERERDILRELDPVQQELLRHREVLAVATAEERAQVEELIRTRQSEVLAAERAEEIMSEIRATGSDAVRGILSDLREGDSAADIFINALDRIANRLADFASDQITQGLFGGGGQGGFGIIGNLLQGALFPGAAPATAPAAPLRPQARPFAMGAVFDRPMMFPMADGEIGLMAEAGREAIMPLTHAYGGGVGALIGGRETTLPLARLASGKLGVDLGAATSPFAMGGVFGDIAATAAPQSWHRTMAADAGAAQAATRPVITLQPIFEDRTSGGVRMEAEEYTDAAGQRQQRYIFSDLMAEGASVRGGRGGRVLRQMGLRPQTRRRGG